MLCFNPIYLKFYCLDECLKYKQFEFVVVKIIKVMKVMVIVVEWYHDVCGGGQGCQNRDLM